MAISTIDQWLLNPEYDSGVSLLKTHAPNSSLIYFFEKKIYGLPRLISELNKVKNRAHQTPAVKPPADKKKYPPEISALRLTANNSWKEFRDLHSTILFVKSKARRRLMAARILELVPMVFDCWRKIDQWEETGDLSFLAPPKEVIVQDDLFTLINKKKTIPTYFTKINTELKTCKDTKRVSFLVSLKAKHESDMKAVDDRLNYLNSKITELCL